MENIIKTFDQYLQNSGKRFQAEIFSNEDLFRDINVDAEKLLITTNTIMESTDENIITKIQINDNKEITFECSCEREKPCMHGYVFFLYCKRNNLFKEFESKIKTMKSKSFEEIIKEESLTELAEIHYNIKEDNKSTADKRYCFESSILDTKQNKYENLEITDNMKIIEDKCIFYSTKKQGFYIDNDDLLKKIILVIFDKTKLSKEEVVYTKHLIDSNFSSIILRK